VNVLKTLVIFVGRRARGTHVHAREYKEGRERVREGRERVAGGLVRSVLTAGYD